MTGGDTEMYFNYDASGTPLSIVYNGTSYYYVTNLQGDVVGIVNQSGNQIVGYTYDAWGNVLTTTGSSAGSLGKYNPLRYRGYVYDVETRLYYLQSRYYNPEWGRFINADALVSTGQGLLGNNMFAYCNNNPANTIDSKGSLPVGLISGLIGAVTNISCAVIQGERGWAILGAGVIGFASGVNSTLNQGIAILSAIDTAVNYTEQTGNIGFGIIAGLVTYGTSFFSGETISKISGVVNMDEAAKLLFDATFTYGANVFNTALLEDIASYPEMMMATHYADKSTWSWSGSTLGPGARPGAA